ncbi:ATP-binding protein [Pontibacter akesuensis]|uniref:Histidine kinase-, DNA gyrase B-, and HSP90-like ATPase n=1 Tax=Pontibacter akesuensis TaxID=388950 RepID=A0A1I7JCD1_9BACT|nr:ATP-binding protein [Pontibacter akesuensis]GHA71006.1 ATPase [Pontibacter akesuensis]SFU82840.1 Histidine kinase-, DNA gyrase B-, and HSP90-like ATPase [Pontibacter akesuensis]
MIDYSSIETTPAEPEAGSMIETFRAIGYSLEAAIADIIDNSISGDAKNIWIDFDWKGAETWLSVKDDGRGMNNEELVQAMRPGSRNPNEIRSSKDLGRFGLGLKTASFSQCRKLTVISKKRGFSSVFWTWDLDFVQKTGNWNLIKLLPAPFTNNQLNDAESGTIIIWNDIDRLVKSFSQNDKAALDKFLQVMEQVKKHLAMTFHRFVENRKISLWFQQREIQAWDPFLINEPATQKFPEEPLHNAKIRVRGFVLPHKSKLADIKFREAEGPKGWNAHQGFYIYRNERLLLAGDWLGMFRKEEHLKLARIMIDLPNSLDAEWQIDIKKSVARPPLVLRDQLKAYASRVRAQAVEVYRHKGKVLKRKYAEVQFQPVWLEKQRHGKRFYSINREHPLLQPHLKADNITPQSFSEILKYIEETIPIPLISLRENEDEAGYCRPFEGATNTLIERDVKIFFESLCHKGKSKEQAKAIILNIEPYDQYPEIIAQLN